MRYLLLVLFTLLFSSPSFADQCEDMSRTLEGTWTWEENGKQRSIEFTGANDSVLIDGKTKAIHLCRSHNSNVFKYVSYRFSSKQDWKSYEIKLQEEDNFLGSAGAEITVGFEKFVLQKNQATTNSTEPLGNTATTNFSSFIGFDGQLFPSMIIATALQKNSSLLQPTNLIPQNKIIGNISSPVRVVINNQEAGALVKIEVDLGKLAQPSSFEVYLEDAGTVYEIRPKISFDYEYLLSIKQPVPLNSKVVIFINGEKVDESIQTLNVRSINDAPFAIVNNDAKSYLDTSWIFAAYVNENHPWIDQLLREALDTGLITEFTGYLTEQPTDVYRQVFAIWNVLQRRGFQYSTISTPTGYSEKVFSQYVRLFSDSISNTQANCIDGTVLFSSILRRIGIDPIIVLVPGHAYLGFYLDKNKQGAAYLETTMLGHTNLRQFAADGTISGEFSKLMGLPTKNKASLDIYIAALNKGTEQTRNAGTKFNTPDDPRYKKIDISEARKSGIIPINQ